MLFGKDAEEVKQKLLEIDTRFAEVLEAVRKTQERQDKKLSELGEQFVGLRMSITAELGKIPEHLTAIQKAREDVEKSTRAFVELQRRVEQFVTQKLGEALREGVESLKTDTDRYATVKKEIESLAGAAQRFGEEVTKFKQLSEHVQKADFELTKHARALALADAEKLKLMKEVDELQRLVARMRRGQQTVQRQT